MASDLFRRCGCRRPDGKQYQPLPNSPTQAQRERACPDMLTDPKHGSWGYYVNAGKDPRTEKRVQHRKTGFATEREARIARNKVAVKVDEGTYTRPNKQTVAQYLAEWLPYRQRTGNGLKPSTLTNYRRYIELDITPTLLGRTRLSEVRRDHVKAFVRDLMDAGRGPVTVRRIVAVLKVAFNSAVDDGLMGSNVAQRIELPTVTKKPIHVWDVQHLEAFRDEAAKHRLGLLFEFVTRTGLRRGEVCGLRWADVDFVESRIWIRHTRVQAEGGVVDQDSAKTSESFGHVELDTATADVLMGWKIQQDAERREWGDLWEDTGFVFTKDDGHPLQPAYVSRLFTTLRVAAGAPTLTLHGLRHEHAALLARAGVDVMVISKRLRHSSIGVTNDYYGHLLPNVSRDAASKVSSILDAKRGRVHTLHTHGGSEGMKKAPAGAANSSDKGLRVSPLPDSNRRPSVYKTDALAS